jgi:hypothetical protein
MGRAAQGVVVGADSDERVETEHLALRRSGGQVRRIGGDLRTAKACSSRWGLARPAGVESAAYGFQLRWGSHSGHRPARRTETDPTVRKLKQRCAIAWVSPVPKRRIRW